LHVNGSVQTRRPVDVLSEAIRILLQGLANGNFHRRTVPVLAKPKRIGCMQSRLQLIRVADFADDNAFLNRRRVNCFIHPDVEHH
jgi:hypothetical protein